MNYIETFVFFKDKLLKGAYETLFMVFVSVFIGIALAIPIAIYIHETRHSDKKYLKVINSIIGAIVNTIRSIPFLIFIVVVMPVSFFIIGTSFGMYASIVPLSIIAFALSTKFIEQSLLTIKPSLTQTAFIMGANKFQTYRYFYWVEIRPHLILGLTTMIISVVSYSSVMGTIAGGGLGDLAIRYGYQEYHPKLMTIVLILMFIIVQIIQQTGNILAKYYDKQKKRGIQ